MAQPDCYVILGVSRNESPSGIRSAFRDLLRRSERAGRSAEIRGAYDVLSDSATRRAYDERLDRATRGAFGPEPVELFGRREAVRPSLDAVVERWMRNFTGLGIPKAERIEALHGDVVLTAEEAAAGGILPIRVPVAARCPECGGAGRVWLFPCLACGESGWVEGRATLPLRIPPGIRPGTILEVPLAGLGIGNFVLQALVRIAG
jgi:molecular chaperone DnaJ/curved DNA-binding protein